MDHLLGYARVSTTDQQPPTGGRPTRLYRPPTDAEDALAVRPPAGC
jgi:hypothetical protein